MAKISPVSAKYMIHTSINIEGVVDKPDVIGAIFGQTEGLLGSELELRELQRSGRIGRIEVKTDIKGGKTSGEIIIPSSLDKAETAVIAAALETIQRIGPCDSRVHITTIEDVRISKRNQVIERAKELLRDLTNKVLPDSQDLTDQVAQSVRMMEIREYGRDRLPAGPAIDDSEEVIVVEGRADVLNLLKHGIKNVIAVNGTKIPDTIKEIGKKKVLTLFVDGDRGGDLIIRGLLNAGVELDYVIKAPDGKEVEEITKKEIHKTLRSKIAIEQVKMEIGTGDIPTNRKPQYQKPQFQKPQYQKTFNTQQKFEKNPPSKLEEKKFKNILNDLIGTRGACILDNKLNILGKVPISELISTVNNVKNIYTIVLDGIIERNLILASENIGINYLVGMSSRVRPQDTKVGILTLNNF
ncbi:MAG: DNA primase [Nanoarchaeota archaeon]|nr:DNA primase [Nanoarchaeota archaeon]